jgi:hypothetical protein
MLIKQRNEQFIVRIVAELFAPDIYILEKLRSIPLLLNLQAVF